MFSPSLSLSSHKKTQSILSANFYNYFLVYPLSQSYFIVSASNKLKGSVVYQLENLFGKSRYKTCPLTEVTVKNALCYKN